MTQSSLRSSDPVDPLLDYTFLSLLPNSLKVLPDPSKPADIDSDLHASQSHLKSMDLQHSLLVDQAKNLIIGAAEALKFGSGQTLGPKNVAVPEKAEGNHRERRPSDVGHRRARFSMKSNFNQPATNLLQPFDVKKYKDADECFRALERHEIARKEIEKQLGGPVFDPAPPTKRIRQPLGVSVKHKHHYPLFNFESLETLKTSIPSPVNCSVETEPSKDAALVKVHLADLTAEVDDDIMVLDEILSQNAEDLQGEQGVLSLLEERYNMKPFQIDELCLSESPKILKSDFVSYRRASSNHTDTDNFVEGISSKPFEKRMKGAEESIHLGSPIQPKSPLLSWLALKKNLIQSDSTSDRFSAYDFDQFPVINPPVENSNTQSQLVDLGEQTTVADKLKSPFLEQKDSSNISKAGAPEVVIEELSHASEKSVAEGSIRMGVHIRLESTRSDVEINKIEGGSNMDRANTQNELDQLHPAATQAHSTDGLLKNVDSGPETHNEIMQEHSAVSLDKQITETLRPQRKRKSTEVSERQSLADELHSAAVEERTKTHEEVIDEQSGTSLDKQIKKKQGPHRKQKSKAALKRKIPAVEEHTTDDLSGKLDSVPETQNEIMREHSAVSLDKKTEAKSRPSRKPKNKEVSKRQSLAGAGTTWQAGVRRSTRIRTRPLEHWKGERLLYGRVHDTLATVIGIKYYSPGKGMTVKSFVSDEYKDLVESVALH